MVLFYVGPHARITNEFYVRLGEPYGLPPTRFALDDLTDVCVLQPIGEPVGTTALTGCLSSVGVAMVAFSGSLAPALKATTLAIAMVTAVILAMLWSSTRRRRPLELHATYRDFPVCLLRSANQQEFGQVLRALRRAIEGLSGH